MYKLIFVISLLSSDFVFADCSQETRSQIDNVERLYNVQLAGSRAAVCQLFQSIMNPSVPFDQRSLNASIAGFPIQQASGNLNPQDHLIVFRNNQQGQFVPTIANANLWRRTSTNQIRAGQRPRYQNQTSLVYRYFDTESLRWNDQGQLVYCSQSNLDNCRSLVPPGSRPQTPPTCENERLLEGSGINFERLRSSNFDCLSHAAKTNNFLAMACNLYFESRAEGSIGMATVAEVTVNRTIGNVNRNNNFRTVAKTVYRGCHFSWVCDPPKVVNIQNPGERTAWHRALAQALESVKYDMQANGRQVLRPYVVNPQLTCYSYYLSLDFYSTQRDLEYLNWADQYYTQTINGPDSQKPICIGRHIFLRDPNEACDMSARTRNAEANYTAIRESFFRGCLHTEPLSYTRGPSIPSNQLCTANSLQQAVSAQYRELPLQSTQGINTSDNGTQIEVSN